MPIATPVIRGERVNENAGRAGPKTADEAICLALKMIATRDVTIFKPVTDF
ncbi:hypothetical protein [Ochrobactrum quorumnocens]|uniref:hypothetical protein n=1 Tax=Ochrobactrum quorumnocens TaxID=271865 RepID=UPI001782CB48|nr:hypothetical protein [[Ochrobactrum] quorumnocens]